MHSGTGAGHAILNLRLFALDYIIRAFRKDSCHWIERIAHSVIFCCSNKSVGLSRCAARYEARMDAHFTTEGTGAQRSYIM